MIHRCATCPFWQKDRSVVGDDNGICILATAPDSCFVRVQAKEKAECRLVTSKAFGCVMHPMNKEIA